jgi:hypothetical protein
LLGTFAVASTRELAVQTAVINKKDTKQSKKSMKGTSVNSRFVSRRAAPPPTSI